MAAVSPLPWMAGIGVPVTSQGLAAGTEKCTTTSVAGESGGSMASWSVTAGAETVRGQASPRAKSADGSSVKGVGPPGTARVLAPEREQVTVKAPAAALTGSEKVTVGLASTATLDEPSVGVVEVTLGATSVAGPPSTVWVPRPSKVSTA